MKFNTQLYGALIVVPFMLGCQHVSQTTSLSSESNSKNNAVQAQWLQLGEQGQLIARVILADPQSKQQCPSIFLDNVEQVMQLRVQPQLLPLRKTVSSVEDSKPSDFPVLVCEQRIDAHVKEVKLLHQTYQVKTQFEKIIFIGDTGCRLQKNSSYYQGCSDERLWAFEKAANLAAQMKPDLVVHVGDYHYRENQCPTGNAACANSPWGYGWDTWNADFFLPAKTLLQSAPWVMTRGNHESCARAGQGWWRLLDVRPFEQGRDCVLESNDDIGNYASPYAVPILRNTEQSKILSQLIVFDSANVTHKPMPQSSLMWKTYVQQMKEVDRLTEQAGNSILVLHHPILGLASERNSKGEQKVFPGNVVLQSAMETLHGTQLFPENIDLTVAGHVHLFEALSFKSKHPVQMVSGNGGSSLDLEIQMSPQNFITPYQHAVVEQFINSNQVGFLVAEWKNDVWLFSAVDVSGKTYATCWMKNKTLTCN